MSNRLENNFFPTICHEQPLSKINWQVAQWEEEETVSFFFFLFEADFIQLVVLNLSHLNYIKLCLFLTFNERWSFKLQFSSVSLYAEL